MVESPDHTAPDGQNDYDYRWLINPLTGEIAFWTADTGLDGQSPVGLDELDLLCIDPLPSYVWYQDMADFADRLTDERAGRRLARAICGRGASRGSKTSCTRSIQTCYRPGMPSTTSAPAAAPSNGWPAARSRR
jgi:hypothetical protein